MPSRRRIASTVETGIPSWRAITGPLMRCSRNPVISLIRSGGDAVLATAGCRAAVAQLRLAATAVACQPAIALPLRDAGRFGRFCHSPTKLFDPPHQQV